MRLRLFSIAFFAASAVGVCTTSYADSDDGCVTIAQGIMRCSSPSAISRDEVRAGLRQAQASGDLHVVGELSGSNGPLSDRVRSGSVQTREEVRQQLLDAQRRGEIEVGDLGRTQAEMFPQRFATDRSDTSRVADRH
jgi:hypothetical protein